MSLRDDDDLSWYARRAARACVEPGAEPEPERVERVTALLTLLRAAGVRGDAASMTLFTRGLPPGCRSCLAGRGSNLYVTGLCTRDCFFCFNQKPRKDELVVHGIPVDDPSRAPEIIERFGLRSVGLSGGEPLLRPERVLAVLKALKAMAHPPRVDLYTNGDLADENLLRRLKGAGLDAVRFDAAARGYDLAPVRLARRFFDEVAVEIPVIPDDREKLERMITELDALGVPYLNLHELFLCADNSARVLAEGARPKDAAQPAHLTWRPTARSLECALELLLSAAQRCLTLSVYLCSCGTQETISRRGLARRRRAPAVAA